MNTPPTVNGLPYLGIYRNIKEDILGYSLDLANTHGGLVRYKQFGKYGYQVSEPEYVKHVLQTNAKNYKKPAFDVSRLDQVFKGGLIGVDGDVWTRQRRIIQPQFARKALMQLIPTMIFLSEGLAKKWEGKIGQTINVFEEMGEVLFSIITQTMLGISIGETQKDIAKACNTINEESRNFNLLARLAGKHFPNLPNPANKKADDAVSLLHLTVSDIISGRKNSEPKNDLLQMLMDARDEESGEGYNDLELRNQIITLMLAGYETSANALTWLWGMLDQYQQHQNDLLDELKYVLGGRAASEGDLKNLKLMKAAIEEGMRLYPSVHTFPRESINNDTINGFDILGGARINIQPYVTHRNPDYWPEPEVFNPHRFLGETSKNIHKYAYIPFGGGPRLCIGYHFAIIEMSILMSILLPRFKLKLNGYTPIAAAHTTLTELNGMPMQLEVRK